MNIVEVKISANKGSSYPIIIEQGLLDNTYDYIEKYTKLADKKVSISDKIIVYNLFDKLSLSRMLRSKTPEHPLPHQYC